MGYYPDLSNHLLEEKAMKQLIISTLLLLSCVVMPPSVPAFDLNTMMMQSTCKITGPGSLGTGFVMAKPDTNSTRGLGFYVLITADHVLQGIQGETAVLVLRQPASSNSWKRVEVPLRIRNGATLLWKKHPDVDVAAMFISLPPHTVERPVPTTFLADDEILEKYEFHPGIELLCLGYPFGAEANALRFPDPEEWPNRLISAHPNEGQSDIPVRLHRFSWE